jgi:hypothetical protein
MAFGDSTIVDRVLNADFQREPLALIAEEVADLAEELGEDEDALDDLAFKLSEVDVTALRITKKARKAIAEALGLDADDIWRD